MRADLRPQWDHDGSDAVPPATPESPGVRALHV